MNRAILFPPATVAHLASEGLHGELADLLTLEKSGMALGLVALPSAVEDSLYRFNNLPARLAALYASRRRLGNARCRFDVVAVTVDTTGRMTVKHLRDAFPATRG